MARANAHVAAGRFPQAIGAFRAAVCLEPAGVAARLGMADAMAAQGRRHEAVAELVEGARLRGDAMAHADAMTLYGRALELDAARVELHVPIARAEHSLGRSQQAVTRIEGLAEQYMHAGRTQEAAELLRMAAGWEEPVATSPRAELADAEPEDDCATVLARNPLLPISPASAPSGGSKYSSDALHSGDSVPLDLELDAALNSLEQETTVARAPRPKTTREADADMVTHVQAPPPPPTTGRRASAKTVWIRPSPGPGALGKATRPATPPTPAVAPPPLPTKLRRTATARASGT